MAMSNLQLPIPWMALDVCHHPPDGNAIRVAAMVERLPILQHYRRHFSLPDDYCFAPLGNQADDRTLSCRDYGPDNPSDVDWETFQDTVEDYRKYYGI